MQEGIPAQILWNHEEIKKAVAETVEVYRNIVYTEGMLKDAKADRAKLNKFAKALEDKRREIKRKCLAPYEVFERQMNEILAIVNEPIALIGAQLDEFEQVRQRKKLERIREIFDAANAPEGLRLEKLMHPKWLNATYSEKQIQEEIAKACEVFAQDIATLSNLPEYSLEAIEVYKQTASISAALMQANQLSEWAKMRAEADAQKAREQVPAAPQPKTEPVEESNRGGQEWVTFRALMDAEEALALRDFFVAHGIKFEAVKG